jgi:hypothetical protein
MAAEAGPGRGAPFPRGPQDDEWHEWKASVMREAEEARARVRRLHGQAVNAGSQPTTDEQVNAA